MSTEPDTDVDTNIYESKKIDISSPDCLKKTLVIPGQKGQKVKISDLGVKIANEKANVLSTVIVTFETGGKEEEKARWSNSRVAYTPRATTINFVAEEGQDVSVKWHLITGNAAYNARMKDLSCIISYELVETSEQVEESKAIIVIECATGEVEVLTTKIKEVAPSTEIYKLTKYMTS